MKQFSYRLRGITMVELIVASTISAVVIMGLFLSLGNIYFSQKKINATQSFASESRFLMERVAQLVRNNTIDYDRFFIEVGPDPTVGLCDKFKERQIPYELRDGSNNPDDISAPFTNNKVSREAIGYPNLFYWNVAEGDIERYRHLGGKKLEVSGDDTLDDCAQAWHGALDTLYLINKEQTERTAIIRNNEGRLQIERLLGVDTEGNGKADSWGFATTWDGVGSQCEVFEDATKTPPSIGNALNVLDEKSCARGHDWTNISPKSIDVVTFDFVPTPNRDPFLSYRIDEAQIQPQSFLRLHTKLRRPRDFGVKSDEIIELTQQTTASSRVFGDPR